MQEGSQPDRNNQSRKYWLPETLHKPNPCLLIPVRAHSSLYLQGPHFVSPIELILTLRHRRASAPLTYFRSLPHYFISSNIRRSSSRPCLPLPLPSARRSRSRAFPLDRSASESAPCQPYLTVPGQTSTPIHWPPGSSIRSSAFAFAFRQKKSPTARRQCHRDSILCQLV